MKKYYKRSWLVTLFVVILICMPACNKTKSNDKKETSFNADKTITENVENLNALLQEKHGKSMAILSIAEYEENGQSDWVLIMEEEKIFIDTATWKYDYDPDSKAGSYMDAIQSTFIFFYGKEMGGALWQLTGDLVDGGADERQYGFTHEGGKAIYKNGDTAAFEPGKNGNFYLRLMPNGLE